MTISERLEQTIRDIPDFPKPGILFKDITPVFSDPQLCKDVVQTIIDQVKHLNLDAIACVEARGFFFGPLVAQEMNIPFIPIRKQGKLPYESYSYSYDLEYGSATIEMHKDAVSKGQRVLIHDDLLATGGTAFASAELISKKAEVVGFSFLVDLTFLNGKEVLQKHSENIFSLVDD